MRIFNTQTIALAQEALLWRQFALLYKAGVNITACCDLLTSEQQRTPIQKLMQHTKKALLSGSTLSQSLRAQKPLLEEMSYRIIELGEQSGKLDELLLLLVKHQEARVQFKKQLINALLYPTVLCITAGIVLLSLMEFVLPRFATLFASANIPLPWMTQTLLSIATFWQGNLLLVLVSCSCIIAFLSQLELRLQIPFFHRLRKTTELAQFARHLGLATQAGLTLSHAIRLSLPKKAELLADELTLKLEQGMSLQKTLASHPYFPPLAIQLVKIGEETGQLDHWLITLADYLELDLITELDRLKQLLEPLIMLILGVVIGGLVICLYLPLFNLGNAF